MKPILRRAIFVWVLLAAAVLCLHAEPIASLHPSNYVNDFAGVLDANSQSKLNDLCHEVEEKANAQMAVVLVKSTDGQEIFDYGVALYQAWGIGKKGQRSRRPDSARDTRSQVLDSRWLRAGIDSSRRESGRLWARGGSAVARRELQWRRHADDYERC